MIGQKFMLDMFVPVIVLRRAQAWSFSLLRNQSNLTLIWQMSLRLSTLNCGGAPMFL